MNRMDFDYNVGSSPMYHQPPHHPQSQYSPASTTRTMSTGAPHTFLSTPHGHREYPYNECSTRSTQQQSNSYMLPAIHYSQPPPHVGVRPSKSCDGFARPDVPVIYQHPPLPRSIVNQSLNRVVNSVGSPAFAPSAHSPSVPTPELSGSNLTGSSYSCSTASSTGQSPEFVGPGSPAGLLKVSHLCQSIRSVSAPMNAALANKIGGLPAVPGKASGASASRTSEPPTNSRSRGSSFVSRRRLASSECAGSGAVRLQTRSSHGTRDRPSKNLPPPPAIPPTFQLTSPANVAPKSTLRNVSAAPTQPPPAPPKAQQQTSRMDKVIPSFLRPLRTRGINHGSSTSTPSGSTTPSSAEGTSLSLPSLTPLFQRTFGRARHAPTSPSASRSLAFSAKNAPPRPPREDGWTLQPPGVPSGRTSESSNRSAGTVGKSAVLGPARGFCPIESESEHSPFDPPEWHASKDIKSCAASPVEMGVDMEIHPSQNMDLSIETAMSAEFNERNYADSLVGSSNSVNKSGCDELTSGRTLPESDTDFSSTPFSSFPPRHSSKLSACEPNAYRGEPLGINANGGRADPTPPLVNEVPELDDTRSSMSTTGTGACTRANSTEFGPEACDRSRLSGSPKGVSNAPLDGYRPVANGQRKKVSSVARIPTMILPPISFSLIDLRSDLLNDDPFSTASSASQAVEESERGGPQNEGGKPLSDLPEEAEEPTLTEDASNESLASITLDRLNILRETTEVNSYAGIESTFENSFKYPRPTEISVKSPPAPLRPPPSPPRSGVDEEESHILGNAGDTFLNWASAPELSLPEIGAFDFEGIDFSALDMMSPGPTSSPAVAEARQAAASVLEDRPQMITTEFGQTFTFQTSREDQGELSIAITENPDIGYLQIAAAAAASRRSAARLRSGAGLRADRLNSNRLSGDDINDSSHYSVASDTTELERRSRSPSRGPTPEPSHPPALSTPTAQSRSATRRQALSIDIGSYLPSLPASTFSEPPTGQPQMASSSGDISLASRTIECQLDDNCFPAQARPFGARSSSLSSQPQTPTRATRRRPSNGADQPALPTVASSLTDSPCSLPDYMNAIFGGAPLPPIPGDRFSTSFSRYDPSTTATTTTTTAMTMTSATTTTPRNESPQQSSFGESMMMTLPSFQLSPSAKHGYGFSADDFHAIGVGSSFSSASSSSASGFSTDGPEKSSTSSSSNAQTSTKTGSHRRQPSQPSLLGGPSLPTILESPETRPLNRPLPPLVNTSEQSIPIVRSPIKPLPSVPTFLPDLSVSTSSSSSSSSSSSISTKYRSPKKQQHHPFSSIRNPRALPPPSYQSVPPPPPTRQHTSSSTCSSSSSSSSSSFSSSTTSFSSSSSAASKSAAAMARTHGLFNPVLHSPGSPPPGALAPVVFCPITMKSRAAQQAGPAASSASSSSASAQRGYSPADTAGNMAGRWW